MAEMRALEDAAFMQEKSLQAEADLQAFDYARSKAGDVNELFDVLKGKLRQGRGSADTETGAGGNASSAHSKLQAHYAGSSGNTVLSRANLTRIQTFLDEPQKHLGQVIADIEKEAGRFYRNVGSLRPQPERGDKQSRQGLLRDQLTKDGRKLCLEDVPEMNKFLGPTSRFGDGDGSFWDRWLTTTGHFTERGTYAKADVPARSMYSTGTVPPHSGFKRYQLDKLAFPTNPEPRVLTYVERRRLGESATDLAKPQRLRGAHSEERFSPSNMERLDNIVPNVEKVFWHTPQSRADQTRSEKDFPASNWSGPGSADTESRVDQGARAESSSTGETPEHELAVLKSLRHKLLTLGHAGEEGYGFGRSASLNDLPNEEQMQAAEYGRPHADPGNNDLGIVHPNYFGSKARTHMYKYFKRVSRRRHQYGHPPAVSSFPARPGDGIGAIPAYEAAINTMKSPLESNASSVIQNTDEYPGRASGPFDPAQSEYGHMLLPPLAANGGTKDKQTREVGEDSADDPLVRTAAIEDAGKFQLTSRTKYLVRCTEANVAPRANIIIRKTHTTKVNLAHQGMGDVMAAILADCLVGLPLVRELSLRDNRLTDKGLIPLVKAIKQRHDLYALDLSENKLDRWAARELAQYLSDPRITLAKFVLSKADVDDFEASNFVKNMRQNKTLTYLDISHNLIGSQESINYVRPEFYTGAEALADWISTESCPLKYLNVSWNTIRLDSAVYFGNALANATNLEELDLGFNCFGAKGGEAIGASLHVNTSLKTLGLASNAINPRACFVIGQGLLRSSSIKNINLSNNALGKVGVGCMVELAAEVGTKIDVDLSSCNFTVDCESCWFDADKLKMSYELQMEDPYDRAVALYLVRRAARDEGLKLKLVAHTFAGATENEVTLVRTARSDRPLPDRASTNDIFRKHDKTKSGSLSRTELAEALEELGLGSVIRGDLAMSHLESAGGRISEAELGELVRTTINRKGIRERRNKAFLADVAKPEAKWVVPAEGKLRLELDYHHLHNQGCFTSIESTDSFVAALLRIGDGMTEVMTHVLENISVEMEQGLKIYSAVLEHLGGDKVKALANIIPRMESASDARLLKNLVLRGLDERRRLRHDLGPAYRPLMGMPMGRYELDMARPIHRLAARKIFECNNKETRARRDGPRGVFDISQKGDWDNLRNETMNGKPFRFRKDLLDDQPSVRHKLDLGEEAGILSMDYVSTTRPPNGEHVSQSRQITPMRTAEFFDVLRLAGLTEDVSWPTITPDEEFDQAVDDALAEVPPRSPTRKTFEFLHFLMTGEGSSGQKSTIPPRPSAMGADKGMQAASRKQLGHRSILQSGFGAHTLQRMGQHSSQQSLPGSTPHAPARETAGGKVGLNAMACRIDELMANRWFSVRQCRFLLLAMEDAFSGEEFLQDVLVDFVVTVYPRIVDIHYYMDLVCCLEERIMAFVIKRVGLLAAWNPCRPDGYLELALDRREDRQVAKMLVHLLVEERGERWASASFRWSMYDQVTPGWMLPVAWYTEEGMPHKGVLGVEYRTGSHINWVLRIALAQTVTLGEVGPEGALQGMDSDHVDAATGSPSKEGNAEKGSGAQGGDGGSWSCLGPGFEAFEGTFRLFDRDFVSTLCSRAGDNFFAYDA